MTGAAATGAAWSGAGADFVILPSAEAARRAVARDEGCFGRVPATWASGVSVLKAAMRQVPAAASWQVSLDYRLLRLGRRVDAVLATGGAVLCVALRPEAAGFSEADRRAVEDAALDLADFHTGCAGLPVLPVLVAGGPRPSPARPLPLPGPAATVLEANARTLPALLEEVAALSAAVGDSGGTGRTAACWSEGEYKPVPGILDAACLLYARHGRAVLDAGADRASLGAARDAVAEAVAAARGSQDSRGSLAVVFVTGQPGAGKTLCGLDAALAADRDGDGRTVRAAFLTGNPTLVHVLREALARQAAPMLGLRAARRRMEGVIQALPRFRDAYAASGAAPPEAVIVVDEAQRCWTRDHAVDRGIGLHDSEPGVLLDIMGRVPGGAVLVCLIGGGQEIHDGEGGLAAWGEALAARPDWRVLAAPGTLDHPDPRQRLPALPGLRTDERLHLHLPVRNLRGPAAAWASRVLAGDAEGARALGPAPFAVTRDLDVLRAALRAGCRGERRAGLVRSSGAARLRAEGLGAVLSHQDENAVARWFLDRWPPDVRSAGALEVAGTEFAVQGLELDQVGLCWDGDLIRRGDAWVVRDFRGTRWTEPRSPERIANRLNAYRVLLTRAREMTILWVPRGSAQDATRDPGTLDAVAEYLLLCGATAMDEAPALPHRPDPDQQCALPSLF